MPPSGSPTWRLASRGSCDGTGPIPGGLLGQHRAPRTRHASRRLVLLACDGPAHWTLVRLPQCPEGLRRGCPHTAWGGWLLSLPAASTLSAPIPGGFAAQATTQRSARGVGRFAVVYSAPIPGRLAELVSAHDVAPDFRRACGAAVRCPRSAQPLCTRRGGGSLASLLAVPNRAGLAERVSAQRSREEGARRLAGITSAAILGGLGAGVRAPLCEEGVRRFAGVSSATWSWCPRAAL